MFEPKWVLSQNCGKCLSGNWFWAKMTGTETVWAMLWNGKQEWSRNVSESISNSSMVGPRQPHDIPWLTLLKYACFLLFFEYSYSRRSSYINCLRRVWHTRSSTRAESEDCQRLWRPCRLYLKGLADLLKGFTSIVLKGLADYIWRPCLL